MFRFFRHPLSYILMRSLGRFSTMRALVAKINRVRRRSKSSIIFAGCTNVVSPGADSNFVLNSLKNTGLYESLKLSESVVNGIVEFARDNPCYADRDAQKGFYLADLELAQHKLGKKILVAQYFNALRFSKDIQSVANDYFINKTAREYLGPAAQLVGVNLWWTFPVEVSNSEKAKHAHFFHRDLDDFKFLKFFFYLTDMEDGDGAHMCVPGSIGDPPTRLFFDRWLLLRYRDEEVIRKFGIGNIKTIKGRVGSGFVEDTLCIHKGQAPLHRPRLILQLEFAVNDYGYASDGRSPSDLRLIVNN